MHCNGITSATVQYKYLYASFLQNAWLTYDISYYLSIIDISYARLGTNGTARRGAELGQICPKGVSGGRYQISIGRVFKLHDDLRSGAEIMRSSTYRLARDYHQQYLGLSIDFYHAVFWCCPKGIFQLSLSSDERVPCHPGVSNIISTGSSLALRTGHLVQVMCCLQNYTSNRLKLSQPSSYNP